MFDKGQKQSSTLSCDSSYSQLSVCMRKPTIWVPTGSDTNRAVQSQKMVRGWKFWIEKVEELYYPCSENKGADKPCRLLQRLNLYCTHHTHELRHEKTDILHM